MSTEEKPKIAEKVLFWEEQDRINQALIPRFIELHESLKVLSDEFSNNNTRIATTESRITSKFEKRLVEIEEHLSRQVKDALENSDFTSMKMQMDTYSDQLLKQQKRVYACFALSISTILLLLFLLVGNL